MLENVYKIETVTYDLIDDIMSIYDSTTSGYYQLLDDIEGFSSVFYEFNELPSFSIECTINFDLEGNDYIDVDGNFIHNDDKVDQNDEDDDDYSDDDYVIEVMINVNPRYIEEAREDVKDELFDVIGHELAHLIQKESHYEFPSGDITEPLEYYTQEHELEAQLVGFVLKSRKTGKPIEEIVRNFFVGKRVKFNLSESMIDELTGLVIKYIKEKGYEPY